MRNQQKHQNIRNNSHNMPTKKITPHPAVEDGDSVLLNPWEPHGKNAEGLSKSHATLNAADRV